MKIMKNVTAATKPRSDALKVADMIEFLEDGMGVDEHTLLDQFIRYLPSSKSIEVLEDFIHMADLDEDWEEWDS